jgi:cyanophycin synthetase
LRGVERLDRLIPVEMTGFDGSKPFDFQAELTELISAAQDMALGPTTQSIVDEAARRGIPRCA